MKLKKIESIEKVFELLGIKQDEIFKVKDDEDDITSEVYKVDNELQVLFKGSTDKWYYSELFYIGDFLSGTAEIIKIPKPLIDCNVYDKCEIHHNCTVEILENSVTGKVSIGWYRESKEDD